MKKIKLRDLTVEQFKEWQNKNLFNDKFLNQEIEIEEKQPILTEEEKAYLSAVIKPFRDKVVFIKKYDYSNNQQYIRIKIINSISIFLPYFKTNKYYKKMEVDREYSLEELWL